MKKQRLATALPFVSPSRRNQSVALGEKSSRLGFAPAQIGEGPLCAVNM